MALCAQSRVPAWSDEGADCCTHPLKPLLLIAAILHSSALGRAGYEPAAPTYQPRNTGMYQSETLAHISPKHWCVSAQRTGMYQLTFSELC